MSNPTTTALKVLEDIRDRHPCGKCVACCEVLGVADLGKPYYTPCKDQCKKGCRIYKERPEGCRVFDCCWKAGYLDHMSIDGRPDRLGVLFDLEEDQHGCWLAVWETRPKAFDTLSEKLVHRVAEQLDALLIISGQKIMGIRFTTYGSKVVGEFPIDPKSYPGKERLAAKNGRGRIFATRDHVHYIYDQRKTLEENECTSTATD